MSKKTAALLLALLIAPGCSGNSDDDVHLTVQVGPNNPGAPPGPTGISDVEVLQIRLAARGESMRVRSLRLHASGTGDDAAGLSQVRLHLDSNGDGVLDPGDALLASSSGFPADDGDLLLPGINQTIFTTGPTDWLVVYDVVPGVAAPGMTFCAGVLDGTDVVAERRGTPTNRVRVSPGIDGCMTAAGGSLTLSLGTNTPGARTAGPCIADESVLQVSLDAGPMEDVRVDSVAFTASGTGDDGADIGGARLYVDADGDGRLGGLDLLLGGPSIYVADDGVLVFSGLGRTLGASAGERWILVYDGAGNIPSGSTYAAAVALDGDVLATGVASGQAAAVTGAPVMGMEITIEQPRLLSAVYTDVDDDGVADAGDTVLVTFGQDVFLVTPVMADDIFSLQPGTFGSSTIGPGATPRQLEIILGPTQFLEPNGTFGVDPNSSGLGIWTGQTGLESCLGIPIPGGGAALDLGGELNPRIVRAGIGDANGSCTVDAGDTLEIVFTTNVTLTTSSPEQAFVLPVGGDSFGTGAQFAGGPMPTNVITVSIVLGATPVLTTAGFFDGASLSPGSPSGVDVSPTSGLVVDAAHPVVTALPLPAGGADVTDPPLWTSVGDDQLGSRYGWSVAFAGDVNGDGFGDIIVGASVFTESAQNEGKAYVYLGGPGGMSTAPAWTSVGDDQADAGFGASVAGAGDVNNDGFDDIIVGAPSMDGAVADEGMVYLYVGGAGGPSALPVWTDLGEDQPGAAFGTSLAGVGDINNDGFDDVLIGAALFDGAGAESGKAYLYLGDPTGLAGAASWSAAGDDQAFAFFGEAVAAAGDVNQDTIPDVVIGAPGFDGALEGIGKVYLHLGGGGTLSAAADWTSSGEVDFEAAFGTSLASPGDVNGDGFSDVIIGAPGFNGKTGKAYAFHGAPAGLSLGPVWISTGDGQIDGGFGRSVAGAGNVDGDGFPDAIVGAFTFTTTRPGAGKVYVYRGGTGGLGSVPWWTTSGEDGALGQFGLSVASPGDVSGDGLSDVLVGAPGFSTTTSGPVGKAAIFCVRP